MTRRVTWRTILVIPSDYTSDSKGRLLPALRLDKTQWEGGMELAMLDVTLEISYVAALHP